MTAPLDGVRVVDLTRMFAGPCATEVLADLGACVIKVEEPRIGDPTRRNLPMWGSGDTAESAYFMSLNRGKRSLTLDLKTDAGRAVLLDLVDGADVLVENFRPGVMDRLGLGYDALSARRPELVFCSLSGFGATGPLRDKISFDLVNQAMAGMIELTGDTGDRPVRIGVPIGDMAGGLFVAVAALAGLRGRADTGRGCWVDLALHDVLIALLSDVAQRALCTGEAVTRTGSRDRDAAPHGRYRALDGWLVLSAVRDEHWAALTGVLGIGPDDRFADAASRKRHETELDGVVEDRLAARDVASWVRELTAAGVPAAPVHSLKDVLEGPSVTDLVYDHTHPAAGPVRNLASPLVVDGRRAGSGEPSPVLGADTASVLAELGYDDAAVARLAEQGGDPVELKVTTVDVDSHGVATVTLNRPDRGNSWTGRMHAEYRWIMAELEADERVRVAVLTGAGRAFCVGADAKALSGYVGGDGYDGGLREEVATPGYGVRTEFDADVSWQLGLRFPLVCAVNGACAGVALAMAAYSDIRFGMHDAKLTTATPKLAMPVEYGLSWILPRLIGVTHAADVLLSGRILRAQELGAMGFFNAVLGPDDFHAHVADYARMLARLSPTATTVTKRQLYDDLLGSDPAASVNRSKELIGELMRHPDYGEGVRALVEKREPRFGS